MLKFMHKLTKNFTLKGNPLVFIESNIHAREWITSATATWFINELLTSTDTEIQDLAQNIDWIIIPVFNVDGFHYTHTTVGNCNMKLSDIQITFCYFTESIVAQNTSESCYNLFWN